MTTGSKYQASADRPAGLSARSRGHVRLMSASPDPERLRDCVGDWLQLPPADLAYELLISSLRQRESWRVYQAVRKNAGHYERGRLVLLSWLASS